MITLDDEQIHRDEVLRDRQKRWPIYLTIGTSLAGLIGVYVAYGLSFMQYEDGTRSDFEFQPEKFVLPLYILLVALGLYRRWRLALGAVIGLLLPLTLMFLTGILRLVQAIEVYAELTFTPLLIETIVSGVLLMAIGAGAFFLVRWLQRAEQRRVYGAKGWHWAFGVVALCGVIWLSLVV